MGKLHLTTGSLALDFSEETGALIDEEGGLVEPFAAAAFALEEVGDVTREPVESEHGYHVIILDEIIPAHTILFDDIYDDLAYSLINEAKENYFNEYYNMVLDAAEITYAVSQAEKAEWIY